MSKSTDRTMKETIAMPFGDTGRLAAPDGWVTTLSPNERRVMRVAGVAIERRKTPDGMDHFAPLWAVAIVDVESSWEGRLDLLSYVVGEADIEFEAALNAVAVTGFESVITYIEDRAYVEDPDSVLLDVGDDDA